MQNIGLFCRALLQKRSMFSGRLLIVATPYLDLRCNIWDLWHEPIWNLITWHKTHQKASLSSMIFSPRGISILFSLCIPLQNPCVPKYLHPSQKSLCEFVIHDLLLPWDIHSIFTLYPSPKSLYSLCIPLHDLLLPWDIHSVFTLFPSPKSLCSLCIPLHNFLLPWEKDTERTQGFVCI